MQSGRKMKISELSAINEGAIWSAIKGIATGQGGKEQLIQDIFIKDFVNDAVTSVKNGIKGGWIDLNLSSNTASPSSDVTSSDSESVSDTNAPEKPTANKPNRSPAEYDLLKSAKKALKKPAFQQTATDRVAIQKARQAGLINEDTYSKLNVIFESIISETEHGIGLSEFLMDWFSQYMQGVNWSKASGRVNQLLTTIENEYPRNFKKNLVTLASLALAISKALAAPKGAPPEYQQAVKSNKINARTSKQSRAELDQLVQSYAKTNPKRFKQLLKTVNSSQ